MTQQRPFNRTTYKPSEEHLRVRQERARNHQRVVSHEAKMDSYRDKAAVTTGEYEPSDEQKLLDADPEFKKFLDSLDHVPF